MSKSPFTLAICQLRTELDYEQTMQKTAAMVREAAESGASLVVLPEMFDCPYNKEYFHKFTAMGHEDAVSRMTCWARENEIVLVGGSVPEKEGDKLYNSSFVFGQDGEQLACHRKIHLFDVDLPGMSFRESNTFTPGSRITVVDTPLCRLGVAVCFDVRFPELFRVMAREGAELICLPAQFNMTTGPAHWEPSLRVRAIDNEVFFAAASAARYDGFSYECWGHSMIIDPFGTPLAAADEKEQILYAEIDLNRIAEVRAQLPTFLHLREDVYSVSAPIEKL